MQTLIIHTENDKIKGIIEFLKAFNISFELKNENKKESVYNSSFIKMMNKSIEEEHEGKLININLDDICK